MNNISCFPSYFPETWWISLYSRLFRLGWINLAYQAKKAAALSLLESQGDFQSVTDEEIINAYKILAKEGVFCEPASAASVAGLIKNKNRIQKESTIVCVLTGNGLKDPDCAIKNNDAIFRKNIEPSLKNITKILGY